MKSTSEPLVVVTILNWNQASITSTCVQSTLDSTYTNYRILVVDNGSTDGSARLLRNEFGALITVLETGENLYFAGGMNAGLEWAMQSTAQYMLILNNDTHMAPDMIAELVDIAESDASIGIVGPMIYYDDPPNRIWALGSRRHSILPFARDIGRGQDDQGQYTQPIEVDFLVGCAMLINRDVLETIGLFDTSYRLYYEDAEFSARAKEAGFRLIAHPTAKLWHLVSVTAQSISVDSQYYHTRCRVRFYREYQFGRARILTHLLLIGQELTRSIWWMVSGQSVMAKASILGLYHGYRDSNST